jgi:hypothetical protein
MRLKPVRPNKFGGKCKDCGVFVSPNGGRLVYNRETRKHDVAHHMRRAVCPTGPWDKWEAYETGGCPEVKKEES